MKILLLKKLLEDLSENVRERCTEIGLSQEKLALDAKVDRTHVSQIERGIGNPSLWVLYKLATILKATVPALQK